MTLSTLFILLLAGQWAVSVLGAICPGWSNMDVCAAAETIRIEPSCNYGGTNTGSHRNLNDGPTSEFQNRCVCSSVYYSLVMACLNGCRREGIRPFNEWVQNCDRSNVFNGGIQYSGSIQIPNWARVSYSPGQRFDPVAASRAAIPQQPPVTTRSRPPVQTPIPPTTSRIQNPVTTPRQEPPTTSNPPVNPNPGPSTTPIPENPGNTDNPSNPGNTDSPEDPDTPNPPNTSSAANSDSPPTNSDGSNVTTDSASSTGVPRATASSGVPNTTDPKAPNFVAPNPSDDPFGLNPNSNKGDKGTDGGNDDDGTIPGDSPGKSNVGAIIGGLVAGLFILLAGAGFIYFVVLRRRRNRTAPSAAYVAQYGEGSTGRIISPSPQTMYSDSRSSSPDLGQPVRPESPTLPRRSTDVHHKPPTQYDPFRFTELQQHSRVDMREAQGPLLCR